MAFDLIIRNATLADGRKGQDVAVAAGRIAAVQPQIGAEAKRTIDARGYLLSPPFVDCHFHMDATLSLGLPRLNVSGALLEGIALWAELKPRLTHEAVAARAFRYCISPCRRGFSPCAATSTFATTGCLPSRRCSR